MCDVADLFDPALFFVFADNVLDFCVERLDIGIVWVVSAESVPFVDFQLGFVGDVVAFEVGMRPRGMVSLEACVRVARKACSALSRLVCLGRLSISFSLGALRHHQGALLHRALVTRPTVTRRLTTPATQGQLQPQTFSRVALCDDNGEASRFAAHFPPGIGHIGLFVHRVAQGRFSGRT